MKPLNFSTLPKFNQHVHISTEGRNTMDHVRTFLAATKLSAILILVHQTI